MTAVSKNVYIEKLDKIVNKYNNIYHRTIKMKPDDVKIIHILTLIKKVKNTDFKFQVIMLEYQNTNTFLQKVTLQIYLKRFL